MIYITIIVIICYCWCGLILRPFHYLTKKKNRLTIEILEKIHIFHVFLRKIKDKKLRKSNQIRNHLVLLLPPLVWLDFGCFYYLTKKINLQIDVLEKIHRFLMFQRNMKKKKLKRSY